MAEHLASIYGTEKDRVNCPFYFKIGACRHGDRCSRFHAKPSISPTLLLFNMYQRPEMVTPGDDAQSKPIDPRKIQDHLELKVGDVYVQFREEEHAANALKNLSGRFYSGRPIIVDFSPVTDFREATCRHMKRAVAIFVDIAILCTLKQPAVEEPIIWKYRRQGRSKSTHRHRISHEQRSHGHGHRRRYDDRNHYHESRSRRHRSPSPVHSRGRSRSPGGKRNRSPVREGSEERRAKIEQWNHDREQKENANNFDKDEINNDKNGNNGYVLNDDKYYHQKV
ncbi:hypothetical protein PTKIN_Ptkin03bG0061100 [Pterospermum kingtungense]